LQFPFPYAQLVKIMLFCYVFSLPFTFDNESGIVHWSEPLVCALFALGFYGVDAIAEMLQDPYGKVGAHRPASVIPLKPHVWAVCFR
jgi:predicted membrane chloride channel (bestrophin family)